MAEAAAQYDNGNQLQPAMNYWLCKDSVKSENFHKIQNLLSNQQKIHHPNWVFPEAVVDIYCGDTNPVRKNICRLQKDPKDPGGPLVTAFASAWIERGWFWNSYNIVLCPRFFEEKTSLEYILYHMKFGDKDQYNASEYKFSWGHTIYHELAHLDPVIAGFPVLDPDYRACRAAKLAYWNGCEPTDPPPYIPEGWDEAKNGPAKSLINADSYAFFASAAYFQNALKLGAPASAPNDCDFYNPRTLDNSTLDPPADFLLDPVNRTDGTYNLKEPLNPAPENTPPDDPPMPPLPYTATALPSDLATPFAPGSAVAYFATYQSEGSLPTTLTTSATSATSATSTIQPLTPSSTAADVSCNCAYKFLFDQFDVSGKNFPADKLNQDGKAGEGLRRQLAGCGGLTEYKFQTLTNDPQGMQWKATGRLLIGTKACVGRAVQTVGGDSPDKCTGAG